MDKGRVVAKVNPFTVATENDIRVIFPLVYMIGIKYI